MSLTTISEASTARLASPISVAKTPMPMNRSRSVVPDSQRAAIAIAATVIAIETPSGRDQVLGVRGPEDQGAGSERQQRRGNRTRGRDRGRTEPPRPVHGSNL